MLKFIPKQFLFALAVFAALPAMAADTPTPQQTAPAAAATPGSALLKEDDILPYLEQMISWHRNVTSIEISSGDSRELLLDSQLEKSALNTISFAFDFARAAAKICDKKSDDDNVPSTDATTHQTLLKAAASADNDAKQMQADLDIINGQLAKSPKRNQAELIAKQGKLESGLKLAKARQQLIQTVLNLSNTTTAKEGGVTGKINNLANTVPELQTEQQKSAAGTAAKPDDSSDVTSVVKQSVSNSKGIIGLGIQVFSSLTRKKQIDSLIEFSTHLHDNNQKLLDKIKDDLKSEVATGNSLAKTSDSDNPLVIQNQRKQLDALLLDFNHLSTAIVPLNQANVWLGVSQRDLAEWDDMLGQELHRILHSLFIRLAVLGVAILIPIILSELTQRAINRYVQDPRRQRQLRTVRRIIFGIIIGLVVLLNLMTEYGSLVTFAGLITAGLAVALQNVILSLVAHFFFFGRYGVRVGDKVLVSGINGEVIKIGMVRLYLMEIGISEAAPVPTGKIIAFPNSILFQPAAFTRFIPGTNYIWGEIKLVLDQNSDFDVANTKLTKAVEEVYAEYDETMRSQQAAVERATHLYVPAFAPKCSLRFTDAGITFIARYPIERTKAGELGDKITRKLLSIIQSEKDLKIVIKS